MYVAVIINLLTLLFVVVIVSKYGLDMKHPYPVGVIKTFSEPYARFLLYSIIYGISLYNDVLALALSVGAMLLHVDYLNLVV